MQRYRRRRIPGSTYFFTLVTYDRSPFLCSDLARKLLRDAITKARADYPFTLEAFVLLPDHMHCMMRLPPTTSDYSIRWNLIKRTFTHNWLKHAGPGAGAGAGAGEGAISSSRRKSGYRGVLQRRFWEHTIEGEEDYSQHLDYIHWNPVKHGHVTCPHAWPHSTFTRHVQAGRYTAAWLCQCHSHPITPPAFPDLPDCE